jgi:predicted amidophosphoribosyltransferase
MICPHCNRHIPFLNDHRCNLCGKDIRETPEKKTTARKTNG